MLKILAVKNVKSLHELELFFTSNVLVNTQLVERTPD